MSNSWYYDILIPFPSSSEQNINDILKIVSDAGYLVKHPANDLISIVDPSKKEIVTFCSLADATTFLSKEGGLLWLWRKMDDADEFADIGLSFNLTGVLESLHPISLKTAGCPWGELRISVDGAYYSQHAEDDTNRLVIAPTIKKLFTELCINQKATYGYSVDEEILEFFKNEFQQLPHSIENRRKPSMIFWLNYFSNEYMAEIGSEPLKLIPSTIDAFPTGITVSVCEYPWDGSVRYLQEINKKWQGI